MADDSGFKSLLSTSKSEYSSQKLESTEMSHKFKKMSTFMTPGVKGPTESQFFRKTKASKTVINAKPNFDRTSRTGTPSLIYQEMETEPSVVRQYPSSVKELLPPPLVGGRRASHMDMTYQRRVATEPEEHPQENKTTTAGAIQITLIKKPEKKRPKLSRLETKFSSITTNPPTTNEKTLKRSGATWEDVFGSFLKEIKLRKATNTDTNEAVSKLSQPSILENPYFTNKPFAHRTAMVHTNPNYIKDFGEFLNGALTLEEFVNRNNFPTVMREKKRQRDILMLRTVGHVFKSLDVNENIDEILAEAERMIENDSKPDGGSPRKFIRRSLSEEKRIQEEEDKKQNNQSKVKRLLDLMRNIIKVKIEKRRNVTIMRKHQEVRSWRFFQTFLDITNEYLMKILNGDLQSSITDRKYYILPSPKKRVLKECFMLTPTNQRNFFSKERHRD